MARRTTKIPSGWQKCATCTHWCGWTSSDVFGIMVEFETDATAVGNGGALGLRMPAMSSCPQWTRRF